MENQEKIDPNQGQEAGANESHTESENEDQNQVASEVEKSVNESENFKEKFYYLAAEMENLKKRNQKELERTIKYGNERILGDLIEVVDNFDRVALALVNDNDQKIKNLKIGMDMVRKQFVDILGKNGLSTIKSIGQIFDPNFHEAVGTEEVNETNKEVKDQQIVKEYLQGYELNGRLLRAAKVVIAELKKIKEN